VAARLASVNPGEVVLCSVVVGELLFGALRSQSVAKNLAGVSAFRAGFISLPFDGSSEQEYAKLRADLSAKGTVIGSNDMFIAAVALARGLIVITHNVAEFSRVAGLSVEDWQI